MKKTVLVLVSIICMTTLTACYNHNSEVAGYIEHVKINGILFSAKLDTGADNCSINAEIVRTYKDGKKTYVEFTLKTDDDEVITLTAPQVRVARIRMRTGSAQRRPVVKLNVTIGKISKEVEVNLADRDRFNYQVLVGRNFLKHGVLVDSSKQYMYSY